MPPSLAPLAYHTAICDYFKRHESDVWNWFASNRVRAEAAEQVKFDLLKTTYRLSRETNEALYEAAAGVAAELALDVPVVLYQAQNPAGLNASVASLVDEAHLVFHGDVASKLSDDELRALLGHELGHLLLWRNWEGDFLVADQILGALTNDPAATPVHFATARLYGLYEEIFCDRGSLAVAGNAQLVVSTLIKTETGLDNVSPQSYIQQAEEIFAKGPITTDGITHPEAYIRTRAVCLWAADGAEADAKIAEMIEGPPALESLDLLGQQQVAALTRRLVDTLLAHRWLRTDSVLDHARLFFEEYQPPDGPVAGDASARRAGDVATDGELARLAGALGTGDASLADYYCYVLLDFVTADRDLEELPLAAALDLAGKLGLMPRFGELARKELRLRKKQLEKIDAEKERLLAEVGRKSKN